MFIGFLVTYWFLVQNVEGVGEARIFDKETRNDTSTTQSTLISPSEILILSGLFDQYQWINRLGFVENVHCRRETESYLEALRNGSIWAAKMYDASGRYNGQFFFGNDFWLGSSVLCWELQNPETNSQIPPFQARYYVAKIHINIGSMVRLIHLGLCLPKSCTNEDVRKLLSEEPRNSLPMDIADVRTVPGSYQLVHDPKFQIIGISGAITVLLIIVASVVEVLVKRKHNQHLRTKVADSERDLPVVGHSLSKEQIIGKKDHSGVKLMFPVRLLLAFSAVTNGNKILSLENKSKDAITCVNGLRVISITWIILVHSYLEVFGVAKNKYLRTIIERNFTYQTIANATFSVDTFFFISGFLLTLGFFRNESDKPNKNRSFRDSLVKFLLMLSYRFVRLTPPYLFVLGANEVVMRYMHNNSVFTPAVIDHITCDKYWWRNALYINNFFPQKEFCMLWSWYITNDSQFFIIASILSIIAIRGKNALKFAAAVVALLLLASWVSTFVIAMRYNYVARVQEPFALFDELYDKPWLRIGPYLIGMIMGYIMYKLKGRVVLTPAVVTIGWTLSLTCLASLVYGLGKHGIVVPASAIYVSLGHTAWALSLAWITVACSSGYGGPFNALLSCRCLMPLSRLTYGAYLVHPVLMFLTSFSLDGSLQIHQMLTVVIFFGNAVLAFAAAFVISLAFEAPAINLVKLFLRGTG